MAFFLYIFFLTSVSFFPLLNPSRGLPLCKVYSLSLVLGGYSLYARDSRDHMEHPCLTALHTNPAQRGVGWDMGCLLLLLAFVQGLLCTGVFFGYSVGFILLPHTKSCFSIRWDWMTPQKSLILRLCAPEEKKFFKKGLFQTFLWKVYTSSWLAAPQIFPCSTTVILIKLRLKIFGAGFPLHAGIIKLLWAKIAELEPPMMFSAGILK